MFDPFQVEKLIKDIHSTPGCHLHASLPCTVWSTWQHINCRKKGAAFIRTLERRRMHSLKLFSHFVQVATAVRQGGGTISFEWPRYCLGWAQQPVLDFIAAFSMSSVLIDGCAFGMNHNGEPIKKQWRIMTDHKRLLDDLAPWTCSKDHKHKEISGSITPKSAYYNSLMCHIILNAVFPFRMCAHVPALSCIPVAESSLTHKRNTK